MYSENPVQDYDVYCAQQERQAAAAVREVRAGECAHCETNVTPHRCTWCGRWTCAECARYDEHFVYCPVCGPLMEIQAHLGAALRQVVAFDDEIIVEHVREAERLADAALDKRRAA